MMRRWPAATWLLVFVASILILNGAHGRRDTGEVIAGIALALLAFAVASYLAVGPFPGRRSPSVAGYALIGGVVLFYLVTAIVAWISVGLGAAVATLLAALIPGTAAAAWLATTRTKTPRREVTRDPAADDRDDPFPGLGMDDERPLGDTPEAHDEINPHDLPLDNPGRHAAERQAEQRGGTTPGHREGGGRADDALVHPEEPDAGARMPR
jgi:hypothetical protein